VSGEASSGSPDLAGSPGPLPGDDPVFREPWEGQAFAMTVLLHQQGLFTWTEWAQALSAQIAADQAPQVTAGQGLGAQFAGHQASSAHVTAPGAGTPYYQHWLAALETLVAAKGLSSPDELTRYQRAWEHAAHRTPHGMSIDLQSEDLGR
jgi:nitrile hydratase accessory protein